MTKRTPQEIARLYVETINGPANGWGQYCHPDYGQSHNIMRALYAAVGHDEGKRLLDEAMAQFKGGKP